MEKSFPPRDIDFGADDMIRQEAVAEQKDKKSGRKKRPIVESPEDLISSAISAAQGILKQNEKLSAAPAFEDDSAVSAPPDDGERSEAERELLKALRAVR